MTSCLTKSQCLAGALVIAMAFSIAQAQAPSPQSGIEIYPPHSPPADMTMMEQALHRRAVEVLHAFPVLWCRQCGIHQSLAAQRSGVDEVAVTKRWGRVA